MSSNYQQKKMMNALGAIDTKGNIVLEQFQDGTALLFQVQHYQRRFRLRIRPSRRQDRRRNHRPTAFQRYSRFRMVE